MPGTGGATLSAEFEIAPLVALTLGISSAGAPGVGGDPDLDRSGLDDPHAATVGERQPRRRHLKGDPTALTGGEPTLAYPSSWATGRTTEP